jgi:hypothetical protein
VDVVGADPLDAEALCREALETNAAARESACSSSGRPKSR